MGHKHNLVYFKHLWWFLFIKRLFFQVFSLMGRFADKNTLFSLDFEQRNEFYKKKKYVTFNLLYLWAKYEHIWLDFTVKAVIFSTYYSRHILWPMQQTLKFTVWTIKSSQMCSYFAHRMNETYSFSCKFFFFFFQIKRKKCIFVSKTSHQRKHLKKRANLGQSSFHHKYDEKRCDGNPISTKR